jgi:hypothetical protein
MARRGGGNLAAIEWLLRAVAVPPVYHSNVTTIAIMR